MQVAWVDGSSYVGTVIAKETAVACIRPDAYPKEYRIWITADDLVGDYQISGSSRGIQIFLHLSLYPHFALKRIFVWPVACY